MQINRLQQDNKGRSRKRKHHIWKRIVAGLACMVVFTTTYMLILPALTLEHKTYCGMEEHIHDEKCYEEQLVCGLEEGETGHIHNDECYEEREVLVCGKKETEAHVHTEKCVKEKKTLNCEEDHEHTDDCYLMEEENVCGLEEGEAAHTHDAGCYETKQVFKCKQKESAEPHTHIESCYGKAAVCGKAEHKHSKSCFVDNEAEEEIKHDWVQVAENVKLSGELNKDVLAVARTQLGYKGNSDDYFVYDDGRKKFYTIYGDMMGDSYADWNAAFALFCLEHAGVPDSYDIYEILGTLEELKPEGTSLEDNYVVSEASETKSAESKATADEEITSGDSKTAETSSENVELKETDTEKTTEETEVTDTDSSQSADIKDTDSVKADITGKDSDKADIKPSDTAGANEKETETGSETENADTETDEINGEVIDSLYYHSKKGYLPKPGDIVFINGSSDGYTVRVGIVSKVNEDGSRIRAIEGDRAGEVQSAGYNTDASKLIGFYTFYDTGNAEEKKPEEALDYAKLSKLLEELEEFIRQKMALIEEASTIALEWDDEGNLINSNEDFVFEMSEEEIDAFYSKASKAETDIEGSHTSEAISDEEYDELSERLQSIYETFIMLAGKGDGGGSDSLVEVQKPVQAPNYIGSVPMQGNKWQITKEGYTGREQSNKVPIDGNGDGKADIYIQKNVVQTDTEDEFLVYLSMDKKMTMETFFDNSMFGVTNSNGTIPGTYMDKIPGNPTAVGAKGETGDKAYKVLVKVYKNQDDTTPLYTYIDTRYGAAPNAKNGSVYMQAPGMNKPLCLQNNVTLKSDGAGKNLIESSIYLNPSLKTDLSFMDVVFDEVIDELGEHIEFIEFVKADGKTSIDADKRIITWNPVDNEKVVSPIKPGPPVSGWENNITQLVYRVRLRTEDKSFNSCGDHLSSKLDSINNGESYKVNESATLSYHFEPLPGATGSSSSTKTVTYPVPEVRGTLYDIHFTKVSDKGNKLAGAEFRLFEKDGTTPVKDADGNDLIVITTADGAGCFIDLPWGDYVLKETKAPPHYSPGPVSTWDIPLCYTKDQSMNTLVLDEMDRQNLRYKAKDNAGEIWKIENVRGEYSYKLKLIKTDKETGKFLKDVEFTVTDPSGGGAISAYTDKNGCISFNGDFLSGIEYVLYEVQAPNGYNMLPADIRFKVTDDKAANIQNVELVNEAELKGLVTLLLSDDGGNSVLTVNVQNEAGYKLPETGGCGTDCFTLSGLALIGIALMYAYVLRRRRGRRAD